MAGVICHIVCFTFILPLLGDPYVKWFSDSQSACKIIQVGGMRNDLLIIALDVFWFCANSSIYIVVQWIPYPEIERGDYITRIIDIDDWQIVSCL